MRNHNSRGEGGLPKGGSELDAGVKCFNDGRYFEAHEVWEEVWRQATGDDKRLLQGLIQAAVALHHYSGQNREGARSVIRRAIANMEWVPEEYCGWSLARFRSDLQGWQQALESASLPPRVQLFPVKPR